MGVEAAKTTLSTLQEEAEHDELGGRRIAELKIWLSACLIFDIFWRTRTYVFQLETTSRVCKVVVDVLKKTPNREKRT